MLLFRIGWAVGRARRLLQIVGCRLRGGHDLVIDFEERGLMRLRCLSCPYRSPGFNVKEPPEGTPPASPEETL